MNTPLPRREVELLDQQVALSSYLESLLCPAPMALPVVAVPTPVPTPTQELIEAPGIVAAPPVAEEAVIVPVTEAPKTEAASAAKEAAVVAAEAVIRPSWAEESFAALTIKVNGLALALPLISISRILTWQEPAFLPGYASWLLGIVHLGDINVRVVDTAALVMPDLPRAAPEPGGEDARRIVLIDGGRWGLVCDSVSEVMTLDPSKVRWRTARTKRPWLAGTVVDELCALLDVDRLCEVLHSGCPEIPSI
jgi:purine-binding chemotaxis protein CheW